jgi:hypothetical protein
MMFHKPRRVLPKVLSFIGTTIAMVAFAGFLAVIIIEWMAGCGETYVDANGQRHQHECVFLTVHNEGEKQ